MLGAAPAYSGLVPPPPTAFATSAPLLTHLHVTLAVALFGEASWVPRLVPLFYGLATQLLLFGLVRARRGALAASATVLAYALVPLAATGATVVRPAAGGLFFALLFVAASLRFDETRGRRAAVVALVALALATHFDRACHLLALVVAAQGLVSARRSTSADERRASGAFAVAILLASLASACVDAALVLVVRGSFGASASRTGDGLAADLVRVASHAHELVGNVFLFLLVAYLVVLLVKWRRGAIDALDRAALLFLALSLGASVLFHAESAIDASRVVYLLPTVALAASSLLPPAGVRARERALGGLALAVCLLVALPETVWKVRARFASGFGSFAAAYDDRYVELEAWEHALAAIPPARREVFVHASVPLDALMLARADAPVRSFTTLADVVARPPATRGGHRLVLVDLMTAGVVPGLPEAAAAHRTTIHQGRFLVLDLDAPGRGVAGYRIRPLSMSRWRAFWGNPYRPAVVWDPIG